MKTIGLIGGMSWDSTAVYYRLINQRIRSHLGGLHSARIVLSSYDFSDIADLQRDGDWESLAQMLAATGRALRDAGADVIAICTNTMHKVADRVQEAADAPLLHIGDALGCALRSDGLKTAALLGTRYTMEAEFMTKRIEDRYGVAMLVPGLKAREETHRIIFDELCQGQVLANSRARLVETIETLKAAGAQAVVLGCTELMLLLSAEDSPLPVYDTTTLHASALAEYAMSDLPAQAA